MEDMNMKRLDVFDPVSPEERRNEGLEMINARIYNDECVDHPKHYGGAENPHEVIKVIESWQLNFHAGSVIKYISRYQHKDNPARDLKKALWYLERLIELEENKNEG
jgi:hypothetical protein|tara:strand:- start:3732 stop:4052 length:321 start_codon:yes stop_codon:yes gene_type:complete